MTRSARRKPVEYVIVWKWKHDIKTGHGVWATEYLDAFDATDAQSKFHSRMRDEYADYSKADVVIREVWPNA